MTSCFRRPRSLISLFALIASGLSAWADAPPLDEEAFQAQERRIEAVAKAEKKACEARQGRAAKLCVLAAKGREKVAQAELEAKYQPSPDTVQEVRNAKADAAYALAREKCGDLKETAKDRCIAAAKSTREAALRLAKVEKVQSMRAAEREAAAERKAAAAKAKAGPA